MNEKIVKGDVVYLIAGAKELDQFTVYNKMVYGIGYKVSNVSGRWVYLEKPNGYGFTHSCQVTSFSLLNYLDKKEPKFQVGDILVVKNASHNYLTSPMVDSLDSLKTVEVGSLEGTRRHESTSIEVVGIKGTPYAYPSEMFELKCEDLPDMDEGADLIGKHILVAGGNIHKVISYNSTKNKLFLQCVSKNNVQPINRFPKSVRKKLADNVWKVVDHVDDFIGKVFITNSGQNARIIESFNDSTGRYRMVAADKENLCNTIYRSKECILKNFKEEVTKLFVKEPWNNSRKVRDYLVKLGYKAVHCCKDEPYIWTYGNGEFITAKRKPNSSFTIRDLPEECENCGLQGKFDNNLCDECHAKLPDGAVPVKLSQENIHRGSWQHYDAQTETYPTQPEEEIIMQSKTTLAVSVKPSQAFATVPAFNVIFGQKVSDLGEPELFAALKRIEEESTTLKDLGTGKSSKRITEQINKLKEAKEQVILAIDALPEEGEDD